MSQETYPLKFRKALIYSGLSENEFRIYWNRLHEVQKEKHTSKELALLISIEAKMRPAFLNLNPAEEYKKNGMLTKIHKQFLGMLA
ncbi:hypothetical protein FH581_015350 [Leptospira weilii]|uniref:hypothetical protein n=1 Tax=Leptospira weilii TaxID=28184 RepID=UPI001EF17E95|nr:hypothetical protein [Leptospira weilii]ULH28717.1 hypothetical protein FH586_20935 [Leptospira weilii]ULH30029.1 hypothetical protein FH586_09340 [Leptospira weilii]UPY76775.1 hypothetical protein FH581_012520 [Leptospira weilii]UPY79582.1 hypothetical protein FH581_015350 [Leptospira weilii]